MRPVNLLLVIVLLFAFSIPVISQTTADNLYLLDVNGKGTEDVKKAKFLLRERKVNDTCWQWDTYNYIGPLVKTERFKDQEASVAHGKFNFYKTSGRLDSSISFVNGLAHGDWYFYNDTGRAYLKKTYQHGRLLNSTDLLKDDKTNSLDSLLTDRKESEFPGGLAGWQRFLNKNLKYPERALNGHIQGEMRLIFTVDEKGKVGEIEIFRSVEFSLDEEALRIIRKSPNWIPAVKEGKIIKSYKIQPVVYRFE